MTQKFKPGDIVRLKSGGPNMTVETFQKGQGKPGDSLYLAQSYGVRYFAKGELNSDRLEEGVLDLVEDTGTKATAPAWTDIPGDPAIFENPPVMLDVEEQNELAKARARAELRCMESESPKEAAMRASHSAQVSNLSSRISYLEGQNQAMKNSLKTGSYYARDVMNSLEVHGPAIVPHLMESGDNPGENLRRWVHIVESNIEREKAEKMRLAKP